jgi:hypothetical protein
MQAFRIEKLETPEQDGDWHDKLLRWIVLGPANEGQKFPTKKEAALYARIRRSSASQLEAISRYAVTA